MTPTLFPADRKSVHEVAVMFKVTDGTVRRWMAGVRGPGGKRVKLGRVRIGGRLWITPELIAKFQSDQNADGGPPPESEAVRMRRHEADLKKLRAMGLDV